MVEHSQIEESRSKGNFFYRFAIFLKAKVHKNVHYNLNFKQSASAQRITVSRL